MEIDKREERGETERREVGEEREIGERERREKKRGER